MEGESKEDEPVYHKGEIVPRAGTYRCDECGELWTTGEINVRFPPCSANKSGAASWHLVSPTGTGGQG